MLERFAKLVLEDPKKAREEFAGYFAILGFVLALIAGVDWLTLLIVAFVAGGVGYFVYGWAQSDLEKWARSQTGGDGGDAGGGDHAAPTHPAPAGGDHAAHAQAHPAPPAANPPAPTPPAPAAAQAQHTAPAADPRIAELEQQLEREKAARKVVEDGLKEVGERAKQAQQRQQEGGQGRPKVEAEDEKPSPRNVLDRLAGLASAVDTYLQEGITNSNIQRLRTRVFQDRKFLEKVPETDWEGNQRIDALKVLQGLEKRIRELKVGDKTPPPASPAPEPPQPSAQPPAQPAASSSGTTFV